MTKPTYDELSRAYDGPIPEEFLHKPRDAERDMEAAIRGHERRAAELLRSAARWTKNCKCSAARRNITDAEDELQQAAVLRHGLAKLRTDKAKETAR